MSAWFYIAVLVFLVAAGPLLVERVVCRLDAKRPHHCVACDRALELDRLVAAEEASIESLAVGLRLLPPSNVTPLVPRQRSAGGES